MNRFFRRTTGSTCNLSLFPKFPTLDCRQGKRTVDRKKVNNQESEELVCEEHSRKERYCPTPPHPNPNRKKVNNQENQERHVKDVVEGTLLPHPTPPKPPKSGTKQKITRPSVGRVPTTTPSPDRGFKGNTMSALGIHLSLGTPLISRQLNDNPATDGPTGTVGGVAAEAAVRWGCDSVVSSSKSSSQGSCPVCCVLSVLLCLSVWG